MPTNHRVERQTLRERNLVVGDRALSDGKPVMYLGRSTWSEMTNEQIAEADRTDAEEQSNGISE